MSTLDLEPIKERLAYFPQPNGDPIQGLFEVADLAALVAEVERLRGQIEGLCAIIDSHPNPLECGKHDDDDPVSCGWKLAYTQVVQQIGGGGAE